MEINSDKEPEGVEIIREKNTIVDHKANTVFHCACLIVGTVHIWALISFAAGDATGDRTVGEYGRLSLLLEMLKKIKYKSSAAIW